MRTDVGAQSAHSLHDLAEIRRRAGRDIHAELTRLAHRSHGPGRADDGLGRHAPYVQAIAAHEMFLDERDLCAESGRARGADQSCRAAADHDQVVAWRGQGVLPVRRMDVRNELLIVRVPREDAGWRLFSH